MNVTHRQGAWYDWRCQAFVGLEGTWRNSSDCVHNHIPPYSGCKKQRDMNQLQEYQQLCNVSHLCVNIPAWMVVPTVAFFMAPVWKTWILCVRAFTGEKEACFGSHYGGRLEEDVLILTRTAALGTAAAPATVAAWGTWAWPAAGVWAWPGAAWAWGAPACCCCANCWAFCCSARACKNTHNKQNQRTT